MTSEENIKKAIELLGLQVNELYSIGDSIREDLPALFDQKLDTWRGRTLKVISMYLTEKDVDWFVKQYKAATWHDRHNFTLAASEKIKMLVSNIEGFITELETRLQHKTKENMTGDGEKSNIKIKTEAAINAIIQQLQELESMCKEPAESVVSVDENDYDYLRECLKRWKDWTVTLLNNKLSRKEGLKFQRKHIRKKYGLKKEIMFREEAKQYYDYLMALKAELEAHPEHIFLISSEEQDDEFILIQNSSVNMEAALDKPTEDGKKAWWKDPKNPWIWVIILALATLIVIIYFGIRQIAIPKISKTEKITHRANIVIDSVRLDGMLISPKGSFPEKFPVKHMEGTVIVYFANEGESDAYPIMWGCGIDTLSMKQLHYRDSLLAGKMIYTPDEDFTETITKHHRYQKGSAFKNKSTNSEGHFFIHFYLIYKDVFDDYHDYYSVVEIVTNLQTGTFKKFPPVTSTYTFKSNEISKIYDAINEPE